ncbi:MAG TPA: NAD-dependent epimerase/dehydratase family protein [Candidatus Dormibacteraeota bacterium]|nr:NAD-dependent epimerase/dehydratase family protein [Candidatus Dormibacteraeota bacterium]
MRVIVLGGTRFIGRAAVEGLVAAGHELMVVHRGQLEPDGMPEVEHLHCERADLATHQKELVAFGADAVIDCFALTRDDAEGALSAIPGVSRWIVISSADVYRAFGALLAGRETDPVPITEESPVRSDRYPYRGMVAGRENYDKLDVEDVYLPRGALVMRLPMVYGERDYQRREEFILRRVRAGRNRIPFGAGSWLTCRGYVRDIARAIRLAIDKPDVTGVLNICEDRTYSVRLWTQMILEAADFEAELVRVPDDVLPQDLQETGGMPQHVLMSANKARNVLGWTTTEPGEALKASVRWHLEHPPSNSSDDFAADDTALEARL